MELRHYYAILRRSWPLVLGLPLLVAVLTILLWFFLPARYGVQVTMLVTQRPLATNGETIPLPDYNNFNNWAASEYVVDDLLQLVETRRFAQDIAAWVKQQHNVDVNVDAVQRGLSAERQHRTVFLLVEAGQRDHAVLIAQGAIENLRQNGLEYWGRGDTTQLSVSVLEQPETVERVPGIVGLALDVILRSLLALLLAVGLAFLRHYLDQTVHRRDDIEALGLDVIGTIPVAKGAKG